MKIFDSNDGWDSKVNFVDENNVFVGYDMSQCCCEHADWFISEEIETTIDKPRTFSDFEPEGWTFDKDFFQEIELPKDEWGYTELDSGGMVCFMLVNGSKRAFLHLFNCHNGYYGHGFEFKVGEEVLRVGGL